MKNLSNRPLNWINNHLEDDTASNGDSQCAVQMELANQIFDAKQGACH